MHPKIDRVQEKAKRAPLRIALWQWNRKTCIIPLALMDKHKVVARIFRALKVAPYSCEETVAKNKVYTKTQSITYLCEMGIFLEVETPV
jgi:hypothetical protein